MNFQFMIYILLGLMLYFYFALKIKSSVYLIGVFLVLILNEIYNNKNYDRKDLFSVAYEDEYVTNYKFDKTINPFEFASKEFKTAIFPTNTHLKEGIACAVQKNLLDEKLKQKKLDYQDAYVNELQEVLFPTEGTLLNIDKIVKGEGVNLDFENQVNPNVFNPIFENEFTREKKCPTVCHLISDFGKCKNAKDIPVFDNQSGFNTWRTNTLDKCAGKRTSTACNSEGTICSFDELSGNCYYDKRKCLVHKDQDDNVECHMRCDYLNDSSDLIKSRNDCLSAKFYSGDNYCEWNQNTNKCVPKCELYEGEIECEKSPDCEFSGGSCQNR